MFNKERNEKEIKVSKQIVFCLDLLNRMVNDFTDSTAEQEKDQWDDYQVIRNHTRFEQDTIRLRRELLKLEKMFKEG